MRTYQSCEVVKASAIKRVDGNIIVTEDGDEIDMGNDWITHHVPIILGHYLVRTKPGDYKVMNSATFTEKFEQMAPPPKVDTPANDSELVPVETPVADAYDVDPNGGSGE